MALVSTQYSHKRGYFATSSRFSEGHTSQGDILCSAARSPGDILSPRHGPEFDMLFFSEKRFRGESDFAPTARHTFFLTKRSNSAATSLPSDVSSRSMSYHSSLKTM